MTVRVETAEATQSNARIDGDGRPPSVIQPPPWKLYTNKLLIVGYYRGKDLVYVARVRNGFVPASRRQVFERICHLVSPIMPFANLPDTHKARWGDELTAEKMKECIWLLHHAGFSVLLGRPEVVAQIEFLEWTAGDRLRHSKFVGLREDKDPLTIVKEHSPEAHL